MKLIKNLFLIVALSAVIIMVIAICLYDYMPNSVTVSKANTYETSSSTTKVLAAITEEAELFNQSSSSSSSQPTPSVILKTYSVTNGDLKVYSASGEYDKGRSDPFADWKSGAEESGGGDSGEGSTSPVPSDDNQVDDGTLFNSSHSK